MKYIDTPDGPISIEEVKALGLAEEFAEEIKAAESDPFEGLDKGSFTAVDGPR